MRRSCPACDGNCYVMVGSGGPMACGTCMGRGWLSHDIVADLRGCIELLAGAAKHAVDHIANAPEHEGDEDVIAELDEALARSRAVLKESDENG